MTEDNGKFIKLVGDVAYTKGKVEELATRLSEIKLNVREEVKLIIEQLRGELNTINKLNKDVEDVKENIEIFRAKLNVLEGKVNELAKFSIRNYFENNPLKAIVFLVLATIMLTLFFAGIINIGEIFKLLTVVK